MPADLQPVPPPMPSMQTKARNSPLPHWRFRFLATTLAPHPERKRVEQPRFF
jgi:hypothetical protein